MLDRLRTTQQWTNSNNDTPSKTEIDETVARTVHEEGKNLLKDVNFY